MNILTRRFLTIIISSTVCLGTVTPVLAQKQNCHLNNSLEATWHKRQAMIDRKKRQRLHSRFVPKVKPLDTTPEIDLYAPRLTRSQTGTKSPKQVVQIQRVIQVSPKKQTRNQNVLYTETQTLPDGRTIKFLRQTGYQQPTVDRSKSGNQMVLDLARHTIDLT